MCGIVGYVGKRNAKDVILDGLKRLEYRGYDSAGIALVRNGSVEIRKKVGEIRNLEELLDNESRRGISFESYTGIGHTRWATHGAPSDINAHPHADQSGTVAIVHNGIIENFVELKERLTRQYHVHFRSETDSEVIAQLIGIYMRDAESLEDAVYAATQDMTGAYAFAVISSKDPNKIVAVRKDAPLIAGIGKGENFIASDIPALLKYCKEIYLIENGEMVVVTADRIDIFDENRNPVRREVFHVTWDVDAAEKEGYPHFMLKEIYEQPKAIEETIARRLDEAGNIRLDGISLTKEDLANISRIYIVACGTAYHAGLVGKFIIEKLAKIPVEVDVASEFRYRNPILDPNGLVIIISQSGETADSLAALREAKARGIRTLGIVNVVGSSIAREADNVFYTLAGPEIAVATTKAYSTQLIAGYTLAIEFAKVRGELEEARYTELITELGTLPEKIERILLDKERIQWFAAKQANAKDVFFIGRGIDYAIGLEGSLKLKEISYIHSEAYAAGELKHGTISLIEKGILVVGILTQPELFEKTVSNMVEVKSRGGYLMGLTSYGNYSIEDTADFTVYVPSTDPYFATSLAVVPLQLLAYYVSVAKGLDVDKPRNLAKSVTVE